MKEKDSMSYSVASRGNVTMIEDLPELSDIEQGHGHEQMAPRGPPMQRGPQGGHIPEGILSPEMAQKLQRHVRNFRTVPGPESGMSAYTHEQREQYEPREQMMQEHFPGPQMNPLTGISCLDIHGHITQCPICSRFFVNDKTVLYVVIVVLTIVCLLLLKRVLDV